MSKMAWLKASRCIRRDHELKVITTEVLSAYNKHGHVDMLWGFAQIKPWRKL